MWLAAGVIVLWLAMSGLWRLTLGWADEIAAAAAEPGAGAVRHGTGASVRVSGASWQQAGQLAVAALRQMGHSDAHVTGSGTERGLDVSGHSIAAQVKYTGAAVGRPLIQQLIGASGGRATAFFSRSGTALMRLRGRPARHGALHAGAAVERCSGQWRRAPPVQQLSGRGAAAKQGRRAPA